MASKTLEKLLPERVKTAALRDPMVHSIDKASSISALQHAISRRISRKGRPAARTAESADY